MPAPDPGRPESAGESAPRTPVGFDLIADLNHAETLARLLGPISRFTRTPIETVGFSGSRHHRFEIVMASGQQHAFIFKHTRLADNWIAHRTMDRLGREAALLAEPALAGVWQAFDCPYRAFAMEPGEIGLLMDDLSDQLFPDVRQPITEGEEDVLLGALASLHARFWQSPALELPWLATATQRLGMPDPSWLDQPYTGPAHPVQERIRDGWRVALNRLPGDVVRLLTRPPAALVREYRDLPTTLIHGDAKVANFMIRPGGGVAAIDWELVGPAPSTFELGWYLAVNASRLARTKELVIARYRSLLQQHLGNAIERSLWQRMVDAGILAGACMMLWTKALGLEAGTPGAEEEWLWWLGHLEASCKAVSRQ